MPGLIVTGGSGCLGGQIVTRALGRGQSVIEIRRNRLIDHRAAETVEHAHDGTAKCIADLLGKCREFTLVHCASKNSPSDAVEDAEALIDGNLRFGYSVLEAIRAAGCRRVLNFGSFWQYGRDGAPSPVNSYAAMKIAFQGLLDYLAQAHDIAAISLILPDTYGEQDRRPKLISLLCRTARTGTALEMSDGHQEIAPLHFDDLLDACFVALDRLADPGERARHSRYFTLGAEVLSVREIVARLERLADTELKVIWGARSRPARLPAAPFLDGPQLPGWAPKITLDDGLRRVLNRNVADGPEVSLDQSAFRTPKSPGF